VCCSCGLPLLQVTTQTTSRALPTAFDTLAAMAAGNENYGANHQQVPAQQHSQEPAPGQTQADARLSSAAAQSAPPQMLVSHNSDAHVKLVPTNAHNISDAAGTKKTLPGVVMLADSTARVQANQTGEPVNGCKTTVNGDGVPSRASSASSSGTPRGKVFVCSRMYFFLCTLRHPVRGRTDAASPTGDVPLRLHEFWVVFHSSSVCVRN
jgi:hypothetical protein